jgi:membrane associated rhomboid family serine protease
MNENLKHIIRFVALLYIIHLLDWVLLYDFNQLGIKPRTLSGLIGIPLSPLLHANWAHLLSNTIPLFFLLFLIGNFYPKKTPVVIFTIVVLGGLLVWIFGRSAVHIGASGLIYGLAAFLVVHGFLQKDVRSLLLSILVIGLYGGLIFGVFPTNRLISWEGHLFGAMSGAFIAYRLRKKVAHE